MKISLTSSFARVISSSATGRDPGGGLHSPHFLGLYSGAPARSLDVRMPTRLGTGIRTKLCHTVLFASAVLWTGCFGTHDDLHDASVDATPRDASPFDSGDRPDGGREAGPDADPYDAGWPDADPYDAGWPDAAPDDAGWPDGSPPPPPECIPGLSYSCTCADGRDGIRMCRPDRTYGVCGCAVDPPPPGRCTAGRDLVCACPDGRLGAQVCRADGSYGTCECAGEPVSPSERLLAIFRRVTDGMIGQWSGTYETPWRGVEAIHIEFRADGTYATDPGALYWGPRGARGYQFRTVDVYASGYVHGDIRLLGPRAPFDIMDRMVLSDDAMQLTMEIWLRDRGHIGPPVLRLRRVR